MGLIFDARSSTALSFGVRLGGRLAHANAVSKQPDSLRHNCCSMEIWGIAVVIAAFK